MNYCYLCKVKLITVILSIYFLALNIVPCSDAEDTKDDSQVVSGIDNNGDHDQTCDLCSPFCQCHCCHCHTVHIEIVVFEPLGPIISRENFSHFDSTEKEFHLSLFQPPRA